MADIQAEALLELSEAEEKKAIFGLISDATTTGELRQMTLGQQAAAQQRVSPKSQLEGERTELVSYSGEDIANRVQVSSGNNINTNNLAFRTGMIRHSFDDGYFALEIHFRSRRAANAGIWRVYPTIIPIEAFNAPTSHTDRLPTFISWRVNSSPTESGIYRVSDTSFAVFDLNQANYYYVSAIYGLKLVVGS